VKAEDFLDNEEVAAPRAEDFLDAEDPKRTWGQYTASLAARGTSGLLGAIPDLGNTIGRLVTGRNVAKENTGKNSYQEFISDKIDDLSGGYTKSGNTVLENAAEYAGGAAAIPAPAGKTTGALTSIVKGAIPDAAASLAYGGAKTAAPDNPIAQIVAPIVAGMTTQGVVSGGKKLLNPQIPEGTAAAARQNVDLTPAQKSGNRFFGWLENLYNNSALSSSKLQERMARANDTTREAYNVILDKIWPEADRDVSKAAVEKLYTDLRSHPEAAAPIAAPQTTKRIKEVLHDFSQSLDLDDATEGMVREKLTRIQKALDGGDVTAGQLARTRQSLNASFESNQGVKKLLNSVNAALDQDIRAAGDVTKGGTIPGFVDAYDEALGAFSRIAKRSELEDLFKQKILVDGDKVSFAKFASVFNPDGRDAKWLKQNMSPEQWQDIQDIVEVARQVKGSRSLANPSHSAYTALDYGQIGAGLTGLGAYLATGDEKYLLGTVPAVSTKVGSRMLANDRVVGAADRVLQGTGTGIKDAARESASLRGVRRGALGANDYEDDQELQRALRRRQYEQSLR